MTRYDSYKLQRFKSSNEHSAGKSTCEAPRSLGSSSSAKSFTGKFFFHNQNIKADVFHQFQTLQMNMDMVDMVTVEAVYHSNSLRKLHNRYRSHNNGKSSCRNNLEMIQGKFTWKWHRSFTDIKANKRFCLCSYIKQSSVLIQS